MGTQGMVRVFSGDEEILCFTRHCDGYPEGLGFEVRDFCAQKRIVNGISSSHDESKIANGAGCLAAQLIAYFKHGVGGIYIEAPMGKEAPIYGYEYQVKCPDFTMVNAAKVAADFGKFEGLPVVVEAFDCSRTGRKRIDLDALPKDEDEDEDEDEESLSEGE